MNFPANHFRALVLGGFLATLPLPALLAATATITPSKDTTIYGNGDAALSNGGGQFLFAGSSGLTGGARKLRSLIAFNLSAAVPAGSTVNSVTLTFGINTPIAANANTVEVHRLSADWGEGTARAGMGEGGGAPAAAGDATWNARILGTSTWTTPGGDFLPAVSASQRVSGNSGTVTFSGAGMVADVQAWVNNATTNFGWILVAQDESGAAVRLGSRQGQDTPQPRLVIDYTAGTSPPPTTNTAPQITTQPASQSVAAGANVTFTAAASGTPTPTLQWQKNGAAISSATGTSLTLSNVSAGDAATYTVVATNVAGTATSNGATLTVTGGGPPVVSTARLSNLSVRASMAANQTLFVGFSVGGGGSKPILIRGVGPTLAGFGLTGIMADPRLELYNGTTLVTQNDSWGNAPTLIAAAASVGAFPLRDSSSDAAMLESIDGTRTVQLKGTGAGVALVELYDTGTTGNARLVNVSARNQVGTGDNILIFGFFVNGTGTRNLLIRAVGARLADFGVTGVLANPRFEVFQGTTVVASNDDWNASLAPTFAAVGAFDLVAGSRDAALVTALSPGSYTVQVSGVGNTTGEALVEIYEVP